MDISESNEQCNVRYVELHSLLVEYQYTLIKYPHSGAYVLFLVLPLIISLFVSCSLFFNFFVELVNNWNNEI